MDREFPGLANAEQLRLHIEIDGRPEILLPQRDLAVAVLKSVNSFVDVTTQDRCVRKS